MDIGVPQGSLLCPLLFILYINNLPIIIDGPCKVVLYADAAALLYASNDPDELQIVLNNH